MLDKYTDPHGPNEYCGDEHCSSHNVCEPIGEAVYRVCLECGHVFRTESDLIEAYRGHIVQSMVALDFSPEVSREKAKEALENTKVEQFYFCPFCSHDF